MSKESMEAKWLTWTKELQAISQAGLAYSKDVYDIERFERIRDMSAEILSEYTSISHKRIKDLFCNEEGYQTPKVDVRGAVFKEGKVLLVKEKIDGCWSMPGGWADVHLSATENIIKEMKEEAGLDVAVKKLIAVLDRKKHHQSPCPYGIYKIFMLCEMVGGTFVKNIETEESGFFDLEDLPKLSEGRVNAEQINMCFKAWQCEDVEVIFD